MTGRRVEGKVGPRLVAANLSVEPIKTFSKKYEKRLDFLGFMLYNNSVR